MIVALHSHARQQIVDVSIEDRPLLTIAGPTAVGKTEISLNVAEKLEAEIVSVDSRQIYQELTIGTAKPGQAARERVPHHFIGERSLQNPISAGQFADEANQHAEQAYHRLRRRYDEFMERSLDRRVSRRRFRTLAQRVKETTIGEYVKSVSIDVAGPQIVLVLNEQRLKQVELTDAGRELETVMAAVADWTQLYVEQVDSDGDD